MRVEPFKILGCRIDAVTWREVIQQVEAHWQNEKPLRIVTLNGENILRVQRDELALRAVNSADLIVPDSTNIILVACIKNGCVKDKIPGSALVFKLLPLLNEQRGRLFLLGGYHDIPEKAAQEIRKKYPNIVVDSSNADPDNEEVIDRIASMKPHLVLVCYGAPKQELWMHKYYKRANGAVYIGAGGTIDMLAGKLPYAPQLFRSLSLEWLWRLILQPKRIGRIFKSVVVFPLKAIFTD